MPSYISNIWKNTQNRTAIRFQFFTKLYSTIKLFSYFFKAYVTLQIQFSPRNGQTSITKLFFIYRLI